MNFKRRSFLVLIIVVTLVTALYGAAAAQSDADQPPVMITFFWREGCSHCAAEKPFLQELMMQNPQIELRAYEVYDSQANLDYLFALGDAMGFETSGVPVTVIGGQSWIGYSEEIGTEISAAVAACSINGCGDPGDTYGLDTSGTVLSLQELSSNEEAVAEATSPWVWVLAIAALLLVSYGVGVLLRRSKKKPAHKRH